jgi:hypothetical protein
MRCPNCAIESARSTGECESCGTPLAQPHYVRTSRTASPSYPREVKSTGLAIVLSFFWPGVGQLYAGRIARGLLLCLAWGFLLLFGLGSVDLAVTDPGQIGVTLGFGRLLILGAVLVLWIWSMVDAKRLCEDFNAGLT